MLADVFKSSVVALVAAVNSVSPVILWRNYTELIPIFWEHLVPRVLTGGKVVSNIAICQADRDKCGIEYTLSEECTAITPRLRQQELVVFWPSSDYDCGGPGSSHELG